jgi:hypothetical protein
MRVSRIFGSRGHISHFVTVSDTLALFVNGSEALVVARRDKDATWRTLGTLCHELGWSRPRLIHELQNGLRYRTFPPGHVFNWHDPSLRRALDVEASTLPLSYTNASGTATVNSSWTLQEAIGIEVLPPVAASASVTWAIATTRRLLAENRIPEDAKKQKAKFACLLAAESQTAAKVGQLSHALKASYLENQLVPWGIWPLNPLK